MQKGDECVSVCEEVTVEVNELVKFTARSGSLDRKSPSRRIYYDSKKAKNAVAGGDRTYEKDVILNSRFTVDGIAYDLEGKADGVLFEEDFYTVDGVLATLADISLFEIEDFSSYNVALIIKAAMLAHSQRYDRVGVRLTLYSLESGDCRYFYDIYSREDLEAYTIAHLTEYTKWYKLKKQIRSDLESSAYSIRFPYSSKREGQSDMIVEAYHACRRGERLFVEAPTGIGKTISAVYSAIKSLGDRMGKRIFYLTPKGTTADAALGAVEKLRASGLRIKSIMIGAKEKCCAVSGETDTCDSVICNRSDGHFDRVNAALEELLNKYDSYTPELIAEYAAKYSVCAYELSLDLSEWCGFIVCDYNYLFDPKVRIRRYFVNNCRPEENIFLIDEAHNLVDRAREIYSSELRLSDFDRIAGKIHRSDLLLYPRVREMMKNIILLGRKTEKEPGGEYGFYLSDRPFEKLYDACREFLGSVKQWFHICADEDLLAAVGKLYERARDFCDAFKMSGEGFNYYVESIGNDVVVRILCIDPSRLLSDTLECGRAAIFFSATLTPPEYYADVFGGGDKRRVLKLASPFDKSNLFIAAMDKVSTRYGDRTTAVKTAAKIIKTAIASKAGNYMAFFPSYKMMNDTLTMFRAFSPLTECRVQRQGMSDSERRTFVEAFSDNSRTKVGFCVLGGLFAEGIDLAGDKLIGAMIFGVGLPKLNSELNIIAHYYDENDRSGYEYAYLYPGFNKVLQAAGRVIRTEKDRGVVILVDDRFADGEYARLYPAHWRGMRLIADCNELQGALFEFWHEDN